MTTIQSLKKTYHTFSKQGAVEEHDIASLSKRLMLDPQSTHDLIAAGHLQPIDASEDGRKLSFDASQLDEIRQHVVDSTCDQAAAGSPHNGTFAAARAILNLQRKVESEVLLFQRNSRLIRLSAVRPEIRFGIGMDMIGSVAKRFLGDEAGAAVAGKIGSAIANPIVKQGLQGAAIGGVIGGGVNAAQDVLNPNAPHKSIIGGALSGAALGGAAEAGTAAIKSKWPTGPAAGLGQSGSYVGKPSPFNSEEISSVPAGSTPRSSAQAPTPSTTDLPGMDAPATPGSSPSYSSGSAGSPFDANDPMGGPSATPAIGTSWKSRLSNRPTQIAGPSYR